MKYFWLSSPTQLLILMKNWRKQIRNQSNLNVLNGDQGQWWSIFLTHLLQILQWWARGGLYISQRTQTDQLFSLLPSLLVSNCLELKSSPYLGCGTTPGSDIEAFKCDQINKININWKTNTVMTNDHKL
jgi:hypothetical protein